MGPPPRSLAAEAHGCFMVRTPRGSNRIQGRGAMSRAQGGLPSVVLPSLVGNGKDPCMMTRLRICTRNNRAFRVGHNTKGGVGPVSPCRADVLPRHLERR